MMQGVWHGVFRYILNFFFLKSEFRGQKNLKYIGKRDADREVPMDTEKKYI